MSATAAVSDKAVDALLEKLEREAEASGYRLNPDRSLLVNQERYGYWACPCRLAAGVKAEDLDIICPCDYRDADLNEFGACFCALYVSAEVAAGERPAASIPERRPPAAARRAARADGSLATPAGRLPLPVWRCKVCGYLCAREEPPGVCPICKAKKERFERFI